MFTQEKQREILAFAHWQGMKAPIFMGVLKAIPSRGHEIFSFEYAENWLSSEYAQHLDPDLQLYAGPQYLRDEKSNFGERIHFASAMTMLGYNDGNDFHDGVSYLELAEFLMQYGASVDKDLEELWRRIVFNICVTNTDDHLRNHGFLLINNGWVLSPAYDINAVEVGTGLKLNISENDNSLDVELALEVSEYFRLKKQRAEEIIEIVKSAVSNWKKLAQSYGISKAEQERMSNAFWNE